MGDRLQTGEPYKGLASAAVSPVLYRIVRKGSIFDVSWRYAVIYRSPWWLLGLETCVWITKILYGMRINKQTGIRKKRTNSTCSISFLIVNYVPKLCVGLVGFVSLGMAARVQLDRYNREDSKTGRVGIPGRLVL
jgi:hypothetical protein